MEIRTKFSIGDKVHTIDPTTIKATEFTVARISTFTSDKSVTTVMLYTDDSALSTHYDESKCFASHKELMDYINDKPF